VTDGLEQLAETDRVFEALAHPARRQILMIDRFRGGEMTAGEIAGRFAHSWPTTTRHLGVLVEAGLLRVEPRGRERVYTLDAEKLLAVTREWLTWFEPEKVTTRRKARDP
jgi:DNA-binding transcriptional ArsR family regulator